MKKVTSYKLRVTLSAFCLLLSAFCLFYGCETCKIKYPKNLKPIDWENYNSVRTVFWNYYAPEAKNQKDEGKEIMVSGWLSHSKYYRGNAGVMIIFEDLSKTDINDPIPIESIHIRCWSSRTDTLIDICSDLKNKLDTCNFMEKCYVKGILKIESITMMGSCAVRYRPTILIENADDIYFK